MILNTGDKSFCYYILRIMIFMPGYLSFFAIGSTAEENFLIHLQGYTFDPLVGEPALAEELKTGLQKQSDHDYYIVQCNGPILKDWRILLQNFTYERMGSTLDLCSTGGSVIP